jgi:CheY-like chemotaxis protein
MLEISTSGMTPLNKPDHLTPARAIAGQKRSRDAHEQVSEPSAADNPSEQLRILLIDDNRDLVETSGALLSHYGYLVASAYSGLSGIEKAKEFKPHVIVCDIGLPDMDGYEVARHILRCGELSGSRLISLSGYAQPSDFENSLEAGFHLHISKPVDFNSLKMILDAIVR